MTAAPVGPRDVGLYVHFPYCEKKCPYCDFNSHAVPHDDRRYGDALLRELERRLPTFGAPAFRTVFFGGGTPSLFAPGEVARLLSRLGPHLTPGAEVTLEANPGTVHEGTFEAFRAAGVNRFSLGVQSFFDDELAALGRIHDAAAAARAVTAARATSARVSLDLMYGLPGQTEARALASIERGLELGTEHLSAYALTVEPDTTFGRLAAAGRFAAMSDDEQAERIEAVTERLGRAGFQRYEISNYARPGAWSLHNLIYWQGGPYLGIGAGAASYLPAPRLAGAARRTNLKAPELYLASNEAGLHRAALEEEVSALDLVAERLMMGLRTRFGVDVADLAAESVLGPALGEAIAAGAAPLADRGWLAWEGPRLHPTPGGMLVLDHVVRELSFAVDRALDRTAGRSTRG